MVLSNALALAPAASTQQSVYNPANGRTCVLSAGTFQHGAARAWARSMCGYLVAVNDAAEQAWIDTTFGGLGEAWLGAADDQVEGVWLRDSGEPFAYANWCVGEPNNYFLENYGAMNEYCTGGPQGFIWNDVWPFAELPALIEIPAGAPSGPSQANSLAATLTINGEGCGGAGPFFVSLAAPGTLSLGWYGPPNAPYALFTGPLYPGSVNLGCSGIIDIGMPPFYADLVLLYGLGTGFPIYFLDAAGAAGHSFTIPAILSGSGHLIDLQGIVIQPPGPCPVVLTAAFSLSVN